ATVSCIPRRRLMVFLQRVAVSRQRLVSDYAGALYRDGGLHRRTTSCIPGRWSVVPRRRAPYRDNVLYPRTTNRRTATASRIIWRRAAAPVRRAVSRCAEPPNTDNEHRPDTAA